MTQEEYPSWSEAMRIGSPALDNDHKVMVEALVKLIETPAMLHNELVDTVAFFVEHATEHFTREEALMRSFDYPYFQEHKDAHRLIQDTFMEKLRPFIQGNMPHQEAVRLYLWLFYDHLQFHDVKFVTFLRAQGWKE